MTSLYREPAAQEHVVPAALEFVDAFKIYRSGEAETVALRGLNLRVEPGELVAVFGPSGSGKSTMLRLACGLEQPSAGEVRAFGRSLTRLGEDELAEYRARSIGIVFQTLNLWPELTASENVELALKLAGRTGNARQALGAFGLENAGERRASVLSGGEQQRVAIAAAAARNAALVLADEPTAELDEGNEARVLDALHRLRNEHGTTVVVVTHSLSVAAAADRVVEIRDGRAQ
ncbi:MAG: putative transport system ATP-binding protein [Gaiellaceae bacterium]|nr:putative transport system ATP-binding protein [Gaiellaceae bacterium]